MQIEGALEIARALFPTVRAPFDIASVFEDLGVIRQRSFCDGQFAEGAVIIEKAIIIINRQRQVSFARIRLESQCRLHRSIGQIETGRAAVKSVPVDSAMYFGEQAPAKQELRITSESFIEQLRRLRKLLSGVKWI